MEKIFIWWQHQKWLRQSQHQNQEERFGRMKKFKDFKLEVSKLEHFAKMFITRQNGLKNLAIFMRIFPRIFSDLKIELFQINPYPDQQAKRQLR